MGERNTRIGTTTQDHLVVDDQKPIVSDTYIVKSGQGVITRGTPLGVETASGKLKKCLSTNSDGSQVIFAILTTDIDTTSADVKSPVYLEGTFNPEEINWQGSDTVETHRMNARKVGIYFKRVY